MKGKLNILLVSSEVVPFSKTGGLADVAGALPKALFSLGLADVRVITPKYKTVDEDKFGLKEIGKISVPISDKIETGKVKFSVFPKVGVPVYFIENDKYYMRDELYRTKNGDYPDNAERFIFFSRGVLEAMKLIDWVPDVIHCNDWQTGLIPAYLKTIYKDDKFYKKTATVFTIHNLAYQGLYSKEMYSLTGLPEELFSPSGIEFWGSMNLMKSGLVYSDVISTVSETYAQEIQTTDEFGRGLEGVLRDKKNDLYGIVNGIDYEEWSPETDEYIAINYDLVNIRKKKRNKDALLSINELPVLKDFPLIGLISRLDDQKGFDILSEVMDELMDMDIQFVLLGTGDKKYHELFEGLESKYPEKLSVNLVFNNKIAHQIYAGSDIFLMPSKFEPCGLGQLISFRYGTVPVVRATGGLADTVEDFDLKSGKGTGFVFKEYSSGALLATLKRAIDIYHNRKAWAKLVISAMTADFSWENSAKKYIDLYEKALEKRS
ncbi:MAG: glycogen synthase GlgA [Candidatus Firestonebacteria bacterium]